MASTFSEMYSDFTEMIKVYTEKLDVTERYFMRLYSRAMQLFQRETEYIEYEVTIPLDANGHFNEPVDLLRIIELKDACGCTFLLQEYQQYRRNIEKWATCSCPDEGFSGYSGYSGLEPSGCKDVTLGRYMETPTDYSLRLPRKVRLAAVFQRRIYLYPYLGDYQITLRYIPDVHAISSNSGQWAAWYPTDTNFYTYFRTSGVSPSLAPYEEAFLNRAVATYLRTVGAAPAADSFDAYFWQSVQMGKVNKPQYFREGVADYFLSPWS